MKTRILLTIVVVCSLYLSVALRPTDEVINLGEVQQNQHIPVLVRVTNPGPRRMRILHVETACDCLTTTNAGQTLEPGASTEIPLTFTAKSPGPFHRTVTVRTDEGPPLETVIEGTVIGLVRTEPQVIRVGQAKVGELVKAPLRIYGATARPKLTGNTTWQVADLQQQDGVYTLDLVNTPVTRLSQLGGNLTIDAGITTVVVPVEGSVVGGAQSQP